MGHWLSAIFAAAVVVALVTGLGSWRRRAGNPAAVPLAVVMAGIAVWSAGDAVLMAAVPVALRQTMIAVLMAGVSVAVLGLWSLPRLLADPSWRPRRRVLPLLAIEPIATVVVAALPATSPLVFAPGPLAAPAGAVRFAAGPWFTVHAAYSYLLIGSALLGLLRRYRTAPPAFRRQVAVLLLSAVPPLAGNVVTIALESGRGAVDITPLGFLLTGLISGYAIFRMGLLRLVPVARGHLVEVMTDAVLVSDPAGRLLDLNPSARRLLAQLRPGLPADPVGRRVADLTSEVVREAMHAPRDPDGGQVVEVAADLWLDVRSTAVTDARGRPLGTISVLRDVSEAHRRLEAVAALNQQLAAQLAVIEQLKADLAEEAVRDHLTGLHNRRHLDRILEEALAQAAGAEPVGLVLLDVDHFKRVNDEHGHAVGDRVLRGIAGVLRAATRPGDTIARLGGEEFVVVLPGADREQARERAEALRTACGLWQHDIPGGGARVTVSAGVAAAPVDGADVAALLEACDRALYAAKAAGRDRVATAVTSSGVPAAR